MLGVLLWNLGTGTIVWGYAGGIFGILVAQATVFPDRVRSIYAFFPLRTKYAVRVLGAVERSCTVRPDRSGMRHAAHLCGALGAWLSRQGMWGWTRRAGSRTTASQGKLSGQPVARKHQTAIP